MSLYHAQDSFEPPLTDTEKKQHWGTPPPSTGPIARPLANDTGQPLLPVLVRNLKAKMASPERTAPSKEKTDTSRENTAPSVPAMNFDYGFRFGIEQRARQLQAQVLGELTATLFHKATGWIKRVASGIFGRAGITSNVHGEGKKRESFTGTVLDMSHDYWQARARFFGSGL